MTSTLLASSASRAGLAALLATALGLARPVPTLAQNQPEGRPTPAQVRDAWQALKQDMVATRNSDNRGQITVEEAEKRFAAHAEAARLLIQGYDEPASGKVLAPGGTITSDALIGGYFPNLARAYGSWMAAQRTKAPSRKYAHYTAVYEALWHGGGGEAKPGAADPKKRSRQLNALYDTPFVRRIAIAAALARRGLALQMAREAGETEVAGVSVSAEMQDLNLLRKLPAAAFDRVDQQPDVEDIVGKSGYLEILGKSAQTVLDAELSKAKPVFRLVSERADWQSEERVKVIAGSVESLGPVTVRVIDSGTQQALPGAIQKNVQGPFDIRVDLEERPAPTRIKLVLDDALSGQSVTYDRDIEIWNIPQPTIAVPWRSRTIADVGVADLAFSVQRGRAGDVVRVEAVDPGGTRKLLEETLAQNGDRSVAVPAFSIKANAETRIRVTIARGGKGLSGEEATVVSRTSPAVAAKIMRVSDAVALVEIAVSDFAERVTRLTMNGIDFPPDVVPVETTDGGANARSRFVFLVPWTGIGEGVTISARTQGDSAEVAVPWPAQPANADPGDQRLARIAPYQRDLARGDLAGAERAYIGVLTDGAHSREAQAVLTDLYDIRLRSAPTGATPEAERYLGDLRILAKAVRRDGDLDARIGQIRTQIRLEKERADQAEAERKARAEAERAKEQKAKEEAEARARDAKKAKEEADAKARLQQTPVAMSVARATYSQADGVLYAKVEVSGLVAGRKVRGIKVDDIEVDGPLADVVKAGSDDTRAVIEVAAVPATSSGALRVVAVIAYPETGDIPVSATVELKPGSLDDITGGVARALTFLRTGKAEGASTPQWLVTMARRRAQRLAAAASAAVAAVTRDKREAGAMTAAAERIKQAADYAAGLRAVTGSDEGAETQAARAALLTAIEPKLKCEGAALVKKPEGFVVKDGATARVQSWSDTLTLSFAGRDVKGTRTGGEWKFPLGGLTGTKGVVKVVAEAPSPDGGNPLRAEVDLTLDLPPSAVAFNYAKPDFVYCDDGGGTRRLVYSANAAGRNDDILVEFDSPQAKLMSWVVERDGGGAVEGTTRAALAPPLDGLAIPAGKLGLGKYVVRIKLWDSNDTNQAPALAEVPLRIAPRAVAFLVGVNFYNQASGSAPLTHAANDALALRAKLIERGYAPENILYVVGRNETGTPEMRSNGVQNPKSETPNDLSEIKRTGQLNGLVSKRYVDSAFNNFLRVLRARQALHALVFFAGHGTNVPATLGSTGSALNVDHLILADDEPGAASRIYVYDWPTRVKASVSWGTKESPVTVMCVYDACRNGTKAVFDALQPNLRSDDGAVVASALFSCQKGEQANENLSSDPKLAIAYESDVFANGFFTYALLKSLDQLPAPGARLPDVLDKAGAVLASLVQQTPDKNKAATGMQKPYSQKQSLRPGDDLKGWEKPLHVVYPVERGGVGYAPIGSPFGMIALVGSGR